MEGFLKLEDKMISDILCRRLRLIFCGWVGLDSGPGSVWGRGGGGSVYIEERLSSLLLMQRPPFG